MSESILSFLKKKTPNKEVPIIPAPKDSEELRIKAAQERLREIGQNTGQGVTRDSSGAFGEGNFQGSLTGTPEGDVNKKEPRHIPS